MKALTLTEPWATLMMLQAKRIETRSWKLPQNMIGVPCAIHAAKGFPGWAKECLSLPSFAKALRPNGIYQYPEVNRGLVLCIVKFIGCRFTEDVRRQIPDDEMCFGDYEDGRYAWMTEFVERLDNPVPAVGHLGFWEWDR